MKMLRLVAAELFGLFVDDGSLALAILATLAALALALHAGLPGRWAGPLGFLALIGVLAENLARTLRRRKA
ncbi:MAG: hypothetical protein KGQ37_07140 [Hyphomicrobiales bacterium]|nr:hypothetical protein [Hyphomicrobiales bacterium]